MRILVVCPHVPWPLDNGGSIRAYRIAAGLTRRHQVHLLALHQDAISADIESHLRETFHAVTFVRHAPQRLLNALLGLRYRPWTLRNYWSGRIRDAVNEAMRDCDLVLFNSLHTAQYARHEWPCVMDSHNVEHLQWARYATIARTPFGRMFCRRQSYLLEDWQVGALDALGAVLACSQLDRDYLGAKAVLAPNGVQPEPPLDRTPEPATFLFMGDLRWRPNGDAVEQLVNVILPELAERIPEVRIEIVGHGPGRRVQKLKRSNVRIVGRVDSVKPYLQRATALVVPLRSGSGTRIKILEAMSAGVPVVTTAVGCEGLDIENGVHALVSDTVEGFAHDCARLVQEPGLAESLSRHGRELVTRQYTWDQTVNVVEEACGLVAAQGNQ